MFRRRRTPPPGRPLLWPWLVLLLAIVITGIAAAYLLTRDKGSAAAKPQVPKAVGLSTATVVARGPSTPRGSQAKKSSTVGLTVSSGPSLVKVPPVVGLTQASATATLSRLGFRLSVSKIPSTKPNGIVLSQVPPSGTRSPKGSIVGLNVSSNPAAGGVAVPSVVGLGQGAAVNRIEQAGLKVDSFPVASKKPQGTVVSQRPAGGTHVPPRSLVRINVSLGPGPRRQLTVPDVLGQAEADAKRTLIQAGFTVQTVDQPTSDPAENGVVVTEKPSGGRHAEAGSQIVIYVGRLPAPTG
jgi:eukaryotic-like serine/threonine-protein kinase